MNPAKHLNDTQLERRALRLVRQAYKQAVDRLDGRKEKMEPLAHLAAGLEETFKECRRRKQSLLAMVVQSAWHMVLTEKSDRILTWLLVLRGLHNLYKEGAR